MHVWLRELRPVFDALLMSAPNSKSIFTLSICLKTRWQNCPSFFGLAFFCFQIRHSVSSAKPTCSSQRNEPAMGFPRRFADDLQAVSKDKAGKPPSNLRFLRKISNCASFYSWNPRKKMNENYITTSNKSNKKGIILEILWKAYGNIVNVFI